MAKATLINGEEVAGGVAWAIDTSPAHDPAYPPRRRRDWAEFTVTEFGAEYLWRTPTDHVRRVARALARGALSFEAARKAPWVKEWFDRRSEDYVLIFDDDEPGVADLPDAKLLRRMLLEVSTDLTEDSPFGYYLEDDDAMLRQAAEALDLPPWATVECHDSGGPGTGFTAAQIVVADGKDLVDIARWLRAGGGR